MTILPMPEHFSEERLWRKLLRLPRRAGRRLLELVLLLYELFRDPAVPPFAKVLIAGTLGYFICPFDLVPDLLPGVGYTDDLAALLALVNSLATHVTDAHRQRARELAERWLSSPRPDSQANPTAPEGGPADGPANDDPR